MHVLVVDEDPDDVDLFCEAIREVNPSMNCFFSRNGREAFDTLRASKEKPLLVFTEIPMREMDGFALIECIKKHKALRNIPVIVYTASQWYFKFNLNQTVNVKEKCKELGYQFIAKPSSYSEIVESVKRCFESNDKQIDIR